MTQNTNQTITVQIISLKESFSQAFDAESFKQFHDNAAAKSNGNLKPLEVSDIKDADYAVIATDDDGKKVGQCLLFNAESGTNKVLPYLPHIDTASDNTLVLTSVTHLKATPAILEEILSSTSLSGKAICAKTKASNSSAKDAFETASFETKGPMTVGSDDYQSYLYHGKNTNANASDRTEHAAIELPPSQNALTHAAI